MVMVLDWLVPLICAAAGALAAPWLCRTYFHHLVPEVIMLRTGTERAELYAYLAVHLTGRPPLRLRVPKGPAWIAGLAAFSLLVKHAGAIPLPLAAVVGASAFPLIYLAPWFLWRRDVRVTARRRMVELGFPLCVYCGYDLRAATCEICPECGNGPYPGVIKPSKKPATAAM